jgi:hypothetical protein
VIELIDRLPIIILSSPRTGSTALAMTLQKKFNCTFFNEPGQIPEQLNNFFRYDLLKKDYILKEHVNVLVKSYNNFNFDNYCVIRIQRKNFIEQLISSYITGKRKNWFYNKNDIEYKDETIELDVKYLKEHIDFLNKYNLATKNYKGKIDFDFYYEDIKNEFDVGIQTMLPKNYVELLNWATNIVKNNL